jgi:hypothetical protein
LAPSNVLKGANLLTSATFGTPTALDEGAMGAGDQLGWYRQVVGCDTGVMPTQVLHARDTLEVFVPLLLVSAVVIALVVKRHPKVFEL